MREKLKQYLTDNFYSEMCYGASTESWMNIVDRFFDQYQPDSSKREDLCKHEYGSSEYENSEKEFYECHKCGHKMRCSEQCGNTLREVQ